MSKSSPSHHRDGASGVSTENPEKRFDGNRQRGLFDGPDHAIPGSMNDASVIRAALVEAIRKCGKSREQLAEDMSQLTGTEVTVRRLNAFTAESREDYRFPIELARAFCEAARSQTLLFHLVELSGFHIISDTEYELLRLGREYLRQERANDNVALLKKRLAGVDL